VIHPFPPCRTELPEREKTKKPRPEGEAVWHGLCGAGALARVTKLLSSDGLDHHVFAQLAAILEYDAARDLGK